MKSFNNIFRSPANFAPMFGLRPYVSNNIYMTLSDVKEAYELAQTIDCPKQREAVYACMGMDHHQVEHLFPSILILEKAWDLEEAQKNNRPNL